MLLHFDRVSLPDTAQNLRAEVRTFLTRHADHLLRPNSDFSSGHDPAFSELLGSRGWVGMTWPKEYGGAERTFFERYVVTEELLAAGAPVSAHWIADRQSGPLLLRYGSAQQCARFLPDIAAGRSFFSIGMSEPNTGSDLASVRTSARRTDGGWLVNGTKLWSTDAHRNHYMVALVRTEPPSENRHAGLSQFIVELSADGVEVRPIRNMSGGEDFNEVVFTDAFVADDQVVGEPGNGWEQVTSELGYERSGPERFLSAFRVFVEFVRLIGDDPAPHEAAAIGRIASHLMTLRRMSVSVAGMLEEGKSPAVEAALVKELGNNFEKALPEIARLAAPGGLSPGSFREAFTDTLLLSPSFTLRGGTREILRGVIARGLGLR
ncbi:MAG: acyl-CoA dehydrogenase family protein [Pseudomonadales bacterium]|nr:acyl-CoA dehydrogenase family protein [Pseudomonadales bacterium]MDP6470597.1 acyl-CoA dehydrogenase family protein [Pseudomonadales bacterium]MDP6828548.1 acyl-CoA dehydrogenase family protein [Pseudomonadales bacterium]MDP6972034.1 acyl-CoA dehydrogenase family protein [Pseudomonadales bacterium]